MNGSQHSIDGKRSGIPQLHEQKTPKNTSVKVSQIFIDLDFQVQQVFQ